MSNNKMSFVSSVLATVGKTDKEVLKETITDRVEDFSLECESQISIIKTSTIPGLNTELKRAKRELTKSTKIVETTKLDLINNTSFAKYVSSLYTAELLEAQEKANIGSIKEAIELAKAEQTKYEAILTTFNQ
jgi:hypothetical protein